MPSSRTIQCYAARFATRQLRSVRFFACNQDLSHDDADTQLPAAVLTGDESLLVVGAMAGG
jgi:molybdopterin synthase sulfur carrier subunit